MSKQYEALMDWSARVIKWMIEQADRDEAAIGTCRFVSLQEAYRKDAANYRAMAREGGKALLEAEGDNP